MSIHLLGYSESTLSRIFSILQAHSFNGEVVIVQNMKVPEEIPFCPSEMRFRKIFFERWRFDEHEQNCLLAVMKPSSKKKVFNFFLERCAVKKNNYNTLVHPAAVMDSTVLLENACIVEPLSVIASFSKIGFGVYINRGCTVGHHVTIGDFASVNPGVHISGNCSIGEGTQLGIGTVVFDHITIGANCIIGGGSVVTKNIPDNVIAWGNPCKVIKDIEV